MGIGRLGIFKFANACCGQDTDEQTMNDSSSPNNQRSKIIQEDYKRFENQTWFRFRKTICFDHKKFIFLYHKYDQEQNNLINHWKNIDMKNPQFGRIGDPDDAKSQRWKYAIRRGVPIIYYKSIISVIFNRNFQILNVKSTYDRLLVQHKIDHIKSKLPPMFGLNETSLKEAVFAPFFNHQGYKALSNILFLLEKTRGGRLQYNPYLVHIIALFLIFFQQQQTYDLVTIMVDTSSGTNDKKANSFRWHCVFKQQQMDSIAQTFYTFISNESGTVKRLAKHFDTNKIDKIKIFKTIFCNFFYLILPFKVILRIFILFLNEGVKFIFRLFYAILKPVEQELKKCQTIDKCLNVIRKKWICVQDEQQYNQLLKSAYNLVLEKYVNIKIQESFYQNKQSIVYYIPYIKNSSQILTSDDLQTIWDYLPQQLRHYDVQRKFPKNQYSDEQDNKYQKQITDLIAVLQTKQEHCILIIQTTTNAVFGVFFARGLIKNRQDYVGHSQNFVFTLSPSKAKYSSTGQNCFFLANKIQSIQIGGGGDGPSLRLNKNSEIGQTFRSNTYKNQPLHGEKGNTFKVKHMEAFILC